MSLSVWNTLTGESESFDPEDPDAVLLYYCGLTVSDFAHLGHARSWVHVDVMRRWLEHIGYTVMHVENFTDVNEKIIARMNDGFGDSELEIAEYFIQQTIADMRSLNLKRPKAYPRVSEHIPEIIALIETLIEKDYAYVSNGSVYYDVTTFDSYGRLSNQDVEAVEVQGDPDEFDEKKHPADFALWKAGSAKPEAINEHRAPGQEPIQEPMGETWGSPWGQGRPGWHIECSAMSMSLLDSKIDIHAGGQDLVFPHHENEIAQSEAATCDQFAKYWLHIHLLETEGEKMSSSLENYFTVRNAVEEFGGNVIRMFLLSTQYSQRQTYSEDALHEAVERWERLSRTYERIVKAADSANAGTKVTAEQLRDHIPQFRSDFTAAMNDNFNTREALSSLFECGRITNRHLDTADKYDYQSLQQVIDLFEEYAENVFGFSFDETTVDDQLFDDLVRMILSLRNEEREAGNFDRADKLRADLEELGIIVEDNADGTSYTLSE